jgi:hypothetical protein
VAELFYIVSANVTALSFLVFYERLNKDAGIVWFRWANRAAMAYVTVQMVLWFFLVIFMCR